MFFIDSLFDYIKDWGVGNITELENLTSRSLSTLYTTLSRTWEMGI